MMEPAPTSDNAVPQAQLLLQFLIAPLSYQIGVSSLSNTGNNLPGLGSATVAGSFAQRSNVTPASAALARSAGSSSDRGIFTINPCTTNLLFVLLTNQAWFDPDIVISNI
jgi:hypothetical protein